MKSAIEICTLLVLLVAPLVFAIRTLRHIRKAHPTEGQAAIWRLGGTWVALAIGMILLHGLLSPPAAHQLVKMLEYGKTTKGVVVESTSGWGGTPENPRCEETFEYEASGKNYRSNVSWYGGCCHPCRDEIGKSATLYYDPTNPTRVTADNPAAKLKMICLSLYLICTVLSTVIVNRFYARDSS